MCGIIGYTGEREAAPILIDGLQRLEYRGYDSAGIAVATEEGTLSLRKAAGKLQALITQMEGSLPFGNAGLGHTRWATHGLPSEINAHPHVDCHGDVVVIHNGIVENYADLKRTLIDQGHHFVSQTDTEVLCHLIEARLDDGDGLTAALRATASLLRGSNVFLALRRQQPGTIVGVRLGNAGGLLIGYGRGEMLAASDLPALLPYTKDVVFLSDRELVTLTPSGATYTDLDGRPLDKRPIVVSTDPVAAAKGGYKHFLLKEIFEQPQAIMDTFRGRALLDPPEILLDDLPFSQGQIAALERVVVMGMGSALHACLVGKFMIEELAGIPTEVDNASEFRYRNPLVSPRTLVVAVTQSGETADSLAAMDEARQKGAPIVVITNTVGSQATRLADGVFLTHCGIEICVAASKTLAGQLTAFYLLATYLARQRRALSDNHLTGLLEDLARVPNLVASVLPGLDAQCEALARRYFRYRDFLYLGRGVQYPMALEGALKLKELSYIHAEGYPAGEMKHGPIALVDENLPVLAIALRDRTYEKMVSNIEQVKARLAKVIAVTDIGNDALAEEVDEVLQVPMVSDLLNPLLTLIPMQLLAYHIAERLGCDVDQPRNLAKTVTVE